MIANDDYSGNTAGSYFDIYRRCAAAHAHALQRRSTTLEGMSMDSAFKEEGMKSYAFGLALDLGHSPPDAS